jgi:syntaxin 16
MNDVKTDMDKLKDRMTELTNAHKEHLTVHFDSGEEDEARIEILTGEIKRLFRSAEVKIKSIGTPPVEGVQRSAEEDAMRKNIQKSLATQLVDMSNTFRKDQRVYMQKLKAQKDRRKQFAAFDDEDLLQEKSERQMEIEQMLYDPKFTEDQIAEMILQEQLVSERDREIRDIAQSITDLAEMFKDLSQLVIEQGTILDRIDYNLEQTSTHMTQAVSELSKASDYQRKARMKLCILLLIVCCITLGVAVMVKAF